MLSCKEFVQLSDKIIDAEKLSFAQIISNKLHLFFCHHCRNYLQQAKTVVLVANQLEHEPVPEPLIESCVTKMKTFSQK